MKTMMTMTTTTNTYKRKHAITNRNQPATSRPFILTASHSISIDPKQLLEAPSHQDVLLRKHADALWEISLRALHHCLEYEAADRSGGWELLVEQLVW